MGAVRRRTGESILLHKARWEEDGAWGKEGPLRASQRSLLPPSKNPVPLSPISLRRYSESRVMATGMVMTERTVDRLTSRAPKGASVL